MCTRKCLAEKVVSVLLLHVPHLTCQEWQDLRPHYCPHLGAFHGSMSPCTLRSRRPSGCPHGSFRVPCAMVSLCSCQNCPYVHGSSDLVCEATPGGFCHHLLSISVYMCLTPSCCLTTHFKWSIGLQLLPEGPLTSKQTKSQHTAYLPTRTSCTSPPINWTESNWIPLQAHLGHTNPFRKTTPIQEYITISILIFDNFVYGFMS